MTRIGYKVVRRTVSPDHFASVLAPVPLIYKPNDTTKPDEDGGPLCLFADRDKAFVWASKRDSIVFPPLIILRCEYEPWDKKLPRDTADASRLVLRERADGFFYESKPYLVWHGCICVCGRLPRGTRLAKSITPLEVVQ